MAKKFDSLSFIDISEGEHFGEIDLLPFKDDKGELKKKEASDDQALRRLFSVQAKSFSRILCLKVEDLERIEQEYPECYTELFKNSLNRLRTTYELRLKAFKQFR